MDKNLIIIQRKDIEEGMRVRLMPTVNDTLYTVVKVEPTEHHNWPKIYVESSVTSRSMVGNHIRAFYMHKEDEDLRVFGKEPKSVAGGAGWAIKYPGGGIVESSLRKTEKEACIYFAHAKRTSWSDLEFQGYECIEVKYKIESIK